MSEQLARLTAALADRYRIERELGAGGMATVYLAHDLRHDRKVAVKVLRPELAAALGHERFLREITTTANLRHPHILPLYDSGAIVGGIDGSGSRVIDGAVGDQSHDPTIPRSHDFLFYVMPYVEGETLRDRIDREKQLPLDDALRIAREVADALSYAHDRGVVHRDVKPENILLESGHAVVADFGIARAVGAAGGEHLTQTGISIGTPTYMSPEQASAEHDLDGRSDLYSLGCVLYETLAGRPPFVGPTVESVVHQHLMSEPTPVTNLRASVPVGVDTAIRRSLAKAPADRYATTAAFGEVLGRPEDVTAERRPGAPTRAVRRWLVPGVVAAAAAIAAIGVLQRPAGAPAEGRPTLAVLPFENLGAPDDEYFADGITEEMTSRLAEISGLGVVSRTSAIRYKNVDMSLREIAEELGVAYVLEGTVRTDRGPDGAGQVRVTPQLIRAQDDSHLWTERYTASLAPGEIFSVQATIAEQVATALDVTLLGSERAALEAAPTDDPAAYDAYLLGRFYWKRRTPADLQRAAEYFRRAVALDPDFAEAHVGLADAYSLYAYYEVPDLSRADAYTAAEVSARRAIGLDRNLAGAWASLGNILTYGAWEWEAADSAFRRAIALDTEYAVARYWYADLLLIVGRIDEAIAQGERAVALDPASPVAQHVLGTALAYDGRYEEAIAREQASIDLVPEFAFGRSGLAWVLALHGRSDEAEREFLRLNWPAGLAANIAQFLADPTLGAGFIAEVSQFERDARDRGLAMAPPSFFGALYGVVGANDSAFARFEQAYTQRSEFLPFNMRHPMLDPIRSDPRYDELMRRMGLAP